MRVLLVDDEPLALDRLRTFFGDIEGVEVVGEAADGNEALEQIIRLTPDLVIMDIQMPGRNGLRTAADIDVDPRPELVFVTAHEHYAPDAFEVDAADYLLKPVRFDRLRQAVGRARLRRKMRESVEQAKQLQEEVESLRAKGALPMVEEDGFWVPERNGQRRVPIESIDWIEASRDYVLLHTPVRSHLLRITMATLARAPLLTLSTKPSTCSVTSAPRGPIGDKKLNSSGSSSRWKPNVLSNANANASSGTIASIVV